MADEQDDRISSFIDANGIRQDKSMLLKALESVQQKLNEVNNVKLTLFQASSLGQAVTAINGISAALKNVTTSTVQLNNATKEQLKKDIDAQRAAKLKAEARAKDADAAYKEYLLQRKKIDDAFKDAQRAAKANAAPTASSPSQGSNIASIELQLKNLRAASEGVKATMRTIGDTQIGRNSAGFKQAAAEADRYDAKIKILEADLKKLSDREKERQAIRAQAGKAESNFDKEVAAGQKVNSTYQALLATLKMLQAEAEELSSRQFINPNSLTALETKRLGDLTAQISQLTAGIDKIDNVTGKAGKNASGYARQLFSLQQILRETPSLSNGIATYLSAIGNNIPIFADDLARIREENKRLAASGQKVESMAKTVAKAFFNWQTVILALVSVMVIFGEAILKNIVALFRSAEANRAAYLASKEYAEIQKKLAEATKALTAAYEKLNAIMNRGNDAGIRALKLELKEMEALGVSAGKLLNAKQSILNLEQSKANSGVVNTATSISKETNIVDNQAKFEGQGKLNKFDKDIQTQEEAVAYLNRTKRRVSADEKERAAEKLRQLKQNRELEAQQIEFADKSIRIRQAFNRQKLEIQDAFNKGEISLQEKQNQDLINAQSFLGRSKDLANDRSKAAQDLVALRSLEKIRANNEVSENNGDPKFNKKKLETADRNLEAAQKNGEAMESIFKQTDEAIIASDEATSAQIELANERRKIASDESRKRVLANANKEVEITKAKNADILSSDTSTYEQKLVALDKITAAEQKAARAQNSDVQNDIGASDADKFAATKQLEASLVSISVSSNRQRIELQQQYKERRLNAIDEANVAENAANQRILEALSSQDEESYANRVAASKQFFEERKRQAEQSYTSELKIIGLNDDEIEKFNRTGEVEIAGKRATYEELLALKSKHENEILSLGIDSAEKQIALIDAKLAREVSLNERHVKELETIYGRFELQTFVGYANETIALNKELIAREVSVKNYFKRRQAIERKNAQDQQENTITRIDSLLFLKPFQDAEKNLEIAKNAFDAASLNLEATPIASNQRKEATEQLAVAERAFQQALDFVQKRNALLGEKATAEQVVPQNNADLELQKIQAKTDAIFNTIQAASEALESLVNRGFELRSQQIEEEMSLLDRRSQKERETIEQSVLNEEEKRRRLGELSVKDEVARESLDKRRRKLEYDRAKAQKFAALAGIGIDTARGIVAANTNPFIGPALIPFIIATGALQAAAVAATPLPKLALGTKDFQGGNVIMGDAWRKELVVEPDGSMWETAAVPTVYNIPKHSVVHPDADKVRTIQNNAFAMSNPGHERGVAVVVPGMDQISQTMKAGFDGLNDTIKNKREVHFPKASLKDAFLKYGSDYYKHI